MRARLNDLKIFDLNIRPLDCLKTRFVSSSRSACISNTKDGHGRIDGTSTSNKEKKHASQDFPFRYSSGLDRLRSHRPDFQGSFERRLRRRLGDFRRRPSAFVFIQSGGIPANGSVRTRSRPARKESQASVHGHEWSTDPFVHWRRRPCEPWSLACCL